MEIYIIVALIIVIAMLLTNKEKKKGRPNTQKPRPKRSSTVQKSVIEPIRQPKFNPDKIIKLDSENDTEINYANGYKSKWMFTYNEKDAFKKIKEITDELGLSLFAKVRLFDLIEPKPGIENRQAHQWKIQAKHVDFVVCDKKLVARMIIELDDASHDSQAGAERDTFVDSVLQSCGYRVIRIRAVEPEKLKAAIQFLFFPELTKT